MTSPVDTSVKYFHSAMPGAPALSGTAGALIAVLDACLVNGFGLKSVDSLVIAGNVATANISTGHSAEIGAVVLMTGATPAALNGEQKVIAISGTAVKFATVGLADQTATGTITLKLASANWAKTFSGTNLAAYKPNDVTATGCMLRVDDTGTRTCRVVGYETMSDINTGAGAFPTLVQRSSGSYWSKSSTVDAAARPWVLIADGRTMYFSRAYYAAAATAYELTVFGDMVPTKSGDAYSGLLSGMSADASTNTVVSTDNYWYASTGQAEVYSPRSYTGLGSSTLMAKLFPTLFTLSSGVGVSGKLANSTPYPNPADGGLYVSPHYLFELAQYVFRGVSPGFYCAPQTIPDGQFAARDSVTGVSGLSGRTLKAITCTSTPPAGIVFLDITGPWR